MNKIFIYNDSFLLIKIYIYKKIYLLVANIIRIRDLDNETNLNGAIFPIDNTGYTYNVRQASILDLKEYILSGFTGGTGAGSSGTSGIDGVDGVDGTTPCVTLISNSIRIVILNNCVLNGEIDCNAS